MLAVHVRRHEYRLPPRRASTALPYVWRTVIPAQEMSNEEARDFILHLIHQGKISLRKDNG